MRRVALALLAGYLVFLLTLALVLFRAPAAGVEPNLKPFRSIARDWRVGGPGFVVNLVGNVVAFLPFGFVPPMVRRRPTRAWQIALLAAGLSLTIEALQLDSGRRTADVDDVLLNTTGASSGTPPTEPGGHSGGPAGSDSAGETLPPDGAIRVAVSEHGPLRRFPGFLCLRLCALCSP